MHLSMHSINAFQQPEQVPVNPCACGRDRGGDQRFCDDAIRYADAGATPCQRACSLAEVVVQARDGGLLRGAAS